MCYQIVLSELLLDFPSYGLANIKFSGTSLDFEVWALLEISGSSYDVCIKLVKVVPIEAR